MKRILFTSSFSIPDDYEQEYEIDYIPFIYTEIYPYYDIIKYIPPDVQSYIVTSKNSAKAIKDIMFFLKEIYHSLFYRIR